MRISDWSSDVCSSDLFLQGQLSQEIAGLAIGASAPSLLLQPTGKVDAWLRATRLADDEVLLDVELGHGEAIEARLRRFRLRTKADLELTTWHGFAVREIGRASGRGRGFRTCRYRWTAVH